MCQPNSVTTLAGSTKRLVLTALCALAVFLLCLPQRSSAQSAARTIARSLDQLTDEADVIVHGYVTSIKVEPHPQLSNLTTVVVSLSVQDTYKGKPQKSLVFRQYVWDRFAEAGSYGKGQELVLLLRPVSEYGLTSPVGLEQGRFRVLHEKGKALAVNGRGNYGLFQSVEQRARARGLQLSPHTIETARRNPAGPLPLADLEDAIRTFARTR